MRTTLRVCLLAALSALPASASAQTVTELYVSPDTLNLNVGQKQGLTVQAFDANGNAILRIGYRSTDDGIVAVEPTGTVTGMAPGYAEIVVTAGRKTKSVFVAVQGESRQSSAAATPPRILIVPPDLATLIIDVTGVWLLPGERARVRAAGLRADGTSTGIVPVTWKSIRPEVATVVDTSGIITGVAVGQGAIQATTSTGISATVPVVVSQDEYFLQQTVVSISVNDSLSLSTVVPKQRARHLQNGDLQWASANLGIAQVSTDGVLKAVGLGKTEVVVRGFGQERRLKVTVHPEIIRFLTSPRLADTVRIPMLATREFKVQAQGADSTPIPDVGLDWVVSDTSVAAFDTATGVLTAKRVGGTTLSFRARGFVANSWNIQVVAAAIGLDQTRLSLLPGARSRLTASYLNESGKPAGAAAGVAWTSTNPGVVNVAPDGTLLGVAPGRATISAVVGAGQPVTALVFVTGEMLFASSRLGKLGLFTLPGGAGDVFIPVVADTFSNNIDPAYSPDRTRIVFSSDKFGTGSYDIYTADADGRNPIRLTTDPALDVQPVWTPDGQYIVFTSARSGANQLMVMKADGTDLRELARLPGGSEEPVVSPDGRFVAFTGRPGARDGQSDIYTVALAGGSPVVAVATKDRKEHSPAYLPNGDLVYVADRKDKREMNLVLRHSGVTTTPPLVSSDAAITAIAISPVGDRIAWIATRTLDKNRTETSLMWRALPTGTETTIRLLPGERVSSPTF